MIYRVEVQPRTGSTDTRGREILNRAQNAGFHQLHSVEVRDLFFLKGELSLDEVSHLSRLLLHDEVTEIVNTYPLQEPVSVPTQIEVAPRPGVTDSVAESLLIAAHESQFLSLEQVATGTCYQIDGDLSVEELTRLATVVLANEVIHTFRVGGGIIPPFLPSQGPDTTVDIIPIRLLDPAALAQLSRSRRLSLNTPEMLSIQQWYQAEGRDPTDLELEMFAQTWSEHCVHKTFRALIRYQEITSEGTHTREIDGLLKQYIRAATEQLNRDFVHSAFVDNAGIVAFNQHFDLAFKVETHNHPSALEPFGGANTGVGGVIRDILGVSARPIANTDILCFGPPDLPVDQIPSGVLHPRRVAEGVVSGVGDYGNKMGIPTVSGAILFDRGYLSNPLVYCGCLGLLPRGSHPRSPQVGNLIVALGGRTGRDGLRGATFSSMEMDHETGQIAGTAVQIGHPIHEKQVQEVVLAARDQKLYTGITDCGAGGFSSAVGEMAAGLGAEIQLKDIPVKYDGLRPWELWLSEAQERMVLAVPPHSLPALTELCDAYGVEWVSLGHFTDTGRLRVWYGQQRVGDLDLHVLHEGIPRRELDAVWHAPPPCDSPLPPVADWNQELLDLMSSIHLRSREDIIRRYDHLVQGGTLVPPLVGSQQQGPGDGVVLVPQDTWMTGSEPIRGVALGVGINPRYGYLDPYAMAWSAVDEALRNVVAVGADPDQVSILDNFCWGNPNLPDRLGALVRCAAGCHDAALGFGTPFISGKDSLNNEYTEIDGQRHAIPGTLLISSLAIVPDVTHTCTMDLKEIGHSVYLLGDTREELGGSVWAQHRAWPGGVVPQPQPHSPSLFRRLHRMIQQGWVQSCHDLSEGGLLVAAAEMCLAGGLGANLSLHSLRVRELTPQAILFGESNGRFLVAVAPAHEGNFVQGMNGLPVTRLGVTTETPELSLSCGDITLNLQIGHIKQAFCGHIQP